MPEEKTQEELGAQEKEQEEAREKTSAEKKNTESRENMIPQSRLNEVLDRAKTAEDELKEIKDTQRAATEKQLVEQGKFKELHEAQSVELAEAKVKLSELDSANEALETAYEAALENVPEKLRGLIPDVSVREKLAYISTNAELLSKATPINVGAGERGGDKDAEDTKVLTAEQKEAADNAGVSHEEYGKYV